MNTGRSFVGVTLVLISAVAFGAMAIFARLAYADGVTPSSLLLLRFGIAAVCMVTVAILRRERFPRGNALAGFALMGGVGYVGQSLCFFTALTMANAGLVALLLYLYPAIVAVLSALLLRERLTIKSILAIVLALGGTVLTVGPRPDARPLGIVLGICAAFIYSGYILTGTRLIRDNDAIPASAVIMGAAAIVFGGIGLFNGVTLPASAAGWTGVIGVALVSTVVAITTFLVGLRVIGATRASVLSTLEPVTTVVLAAALLQEPLGATAVFGGLLILVGAVMLSGGDTPDAPRVVTD